MRIAAGVLLIIVSIFSACAGVGYGFGGAMVSGAGDLGNAMGDMAKEMAATELTAAKASGDADRIAAAEKAVADADKASADLKGNADLQNAKAAGGGLMLFGIFLLVLFGLQIAGAVCLFTQKAAMFALIVGVLSILGEVGGMAFTGFKIFNILGLVAGLLAILASRSYNKAPAAG